jgi:hypothetical protein
MTHYYLILKCYTRDSRYLMITLIKHRWFGGLNSKAFVRPKLSLSLHQWSRDFTNLKLRVKKRERKNFFFEILF